jgi:hypothetical protein
MCVTVFFASLGGVHVAVTKTAQFAFVDSLAFLD